MSKELFPTIYACAKAQGLDEDGRRDAFEQLTGKRSLTLMTHGEVKKIADHFKRLSSPKGKGKGIAKHDGVRKIHVLWRELGRAGALNNPERAGLNAFIRRRFGDHWNSIPADVDMLRDPAQINEVIEALKSWCQRAGVELSR